MAILGRGEGGEHILGHLTDETGALLALRHIQDNAIDERERFERDFLERYRTLATLSQELSMFVKVSFNLGGDEGTHQDGNEALAQLALDNSAADTGRFAGGIAGGAAAGAAIGSIVPGLGTVIGAGVGGLVGYLSWNYNSSNPRQASKFRDEVRSSVREAATSYFSALRRSVMRSFGTCANHAWRALDQLMDDYLVAYGRTIEALREHDLAEQERLMEELELIRADEDLIKHRMELLHATLARFHKL